MKISEIRFDLALFGAGDSVMGTDGVINSNSGNVTAYSDEEGLSAEMRTYYSDYLIDNAEPALIYDRFAQKITIPKNSGKTVQFRKYDPLPTLTEPIAEGVTPTGQTVSMTTVSATLAQYGGYVELSDLLLMTAVDNNLCMATKLLGAQAGRTLDRITREVLCGGTNVQYGEGFYSARHLLDTNVHMTVAAVRNAVRSLKNQGAEKIGDSYVGIIHPDCAYDLMSDVSWRYPHQYAAPEAIFDGEIGKIEGVRFIESTEAKVIKAQGFGEGLDTLTVDTVTSGAPTLTIRERSDMDGDYVGKSIVINSQLFYIVASSGNILTLSFDPEGNSIPILYMNSGDIIYSGDAGAMGADIYLTLIFGENAYGTTSLADNGLQHIVKQLGSGGSSDPLNQRATVGWKANKVTTRLTEAFMIRIETSSSYAN